MVILGVVADVLPEDLHQNGGGLHAELRCGPLQGHRAASVELDRQDLPSPATRTIAVRGTRRGHLDRSLVGHNP